MTTELSYASGPADTGLLGITIGDMLDRDRCKTRC